MSEKYILAIDGGTQSTKVLIFDFQGNVVAQGRQKLRPMEAPQTGWAEHPDDDLWASLLLACREAFSNFSGDPKDIIGVGLCTIRTCRVWLRGDGSLAYPVINWMDPRAYGPFVVPEGAKDVKYATTTTGYMTHRLTGQFKDTAANCLYWQWPTDARTWMWSEDRAVFDYFQLKREQMMELHMPGDILGTVTKEAAAATGIPLGIPVVATANDRAVEALGTGFMQGDSGLIALGTYSTAMLKGTQLQENSKSYWPNFACVPHQYLFEIMQGIHRGMWTVSWMGNLLAAGDLQQLNAEAAAVPAGSNGLMTVPEWLVVNSANTFKKGIILGFDVRHGRGHMFRSLMEGTTLKLYNGFRAMCEETGIFPSQLVASGGGSKGDTFMQIIADVFGLPVQRNEVEDAAGTGAAICAAVATGVYPDFDTAAKAMVRVKDSFLPNMDNHALYMRMNDEVFRHITQATDSLLEKSYPLFN